MADRDYARGEPRPLRVLLTNDDGIEAPGLAVLEAALPAGCSPTIVAPWEERSACSHQVVTARPMRPVRLGSRRVAVDAFPADCVRLAFHERWGPFDWVLAGVNHGANLGADIYYSGTVAAAREAALLGIRAIAVSHYRDRLLDDSDWDRARGWVRRLLPTLLSAPLGQGEYWNVNLPSLPSGPADPPVVECSVDTSPVQVRYSADGPERLYSGVYTERPRRVGSDVDVCFGGSISVSRLSLP